MGRAKGTTGGASGDGRTSLWATPDHVDATTWQRADALAAHVEPVVRTLVEHERTTPEHLRQRLVAAVLHTGRTNDLYTRYAAQRTGTVPPAPAGADGSGDGGAPPPGRQRGPGWFRTHVWNEPWAVFLAVTVAAAWTFAEFRQHPQWQPVALEAFVVLLATLLPAFLYLRFVSFRVRPLWEEYVYNLHRLGVDAPAHLPEPPHGSQPWQRWHDRGGPLSRDASRIYRDKFQSQYVAWPDAPEGRQKESLGRLMSVYLCTAVLGVGWALVVWGGSVPPSEELRPLLDVLRYGFLGAYFFLLSSLVRRYFQNDLRPGAYLAGVVRIVTVLVLVAAVHQAFASPLLNGGEAEHPSTQNVVAFMIGVFPSVGMQLLRRLVGKVVGRFRGGLEPPFPLSQLDGMDIWSEARLLEIGVEDVQHLTTANLVDVCLGARIPTQRIVDWVDQGLLLLHAGMPRADNLEEPSTYLELRALGIRSATDLLDVLEDMDVTSCSADSWPKDKRPADLLAQAGPGQPVRRKPLRKPHVNPSTCPLLVRMALVGKALAHDPNLVHVRHWQGTVPDETAEPVLGPTGTPAGRPR